MGVGDAIMASGHARVAQLKDPRKVRIQHGHRVPWSEVWDGNPRIARPGDGGEVQILYARSLDSNMRRYHRGKTHTQWTYNLEFRPDVGELYLTGAEKQFAAQHKPQVILEPNIKAGASPNKQWGFARWQRFAELAARDGIQLSQIGQYGVARLAGVQFIETQSFRLGCAVLATASAYVGGEGGLHHAAAALGVPGVVVFGGFTPVELTGYAIHRNLGVSLGAACGMRLPCTHCVREMARITPEQVLDNLKEVLQ